VLRWSGLTFETEVIPLGGPNFGIRQMPELLAISSAGTVPMLRIGSDVIHESLAIAEWAAEQEPSLWPADPLARAYARAAASEMHAGFTEIRDQLPTNIRLRATPKPLSVQLSREFARLEQLWTGLRARFGGDGPYLFGARSIADAFYVPVATRVRTYSASLSTHSQHYVDTLLSDRAFQEWETAAEQEVWTIPKYELV